jgi:hypothetical protein
MKNTAEEVLNKIEFLFKRYSMERRATTQPFLLDVVKEKIEGYQYDPSDNLIRETLMEHVGSTPVVATALFPYIQDPEVDLGEALIMLAIHDIGELITHDKMIFTKKENEKDNEHEAALKLLDPYYHKTYKDVESKASKTAQFAKAIDKITPDILDYLTPVDITVPRYKYFVGIGKEEIIPLIVKHKRPYMLWNPFMEEFHKYLIAKFEAKMRSE